MLPSTERPGFICLNGASRYKRRSAFATSGFVVTVETDRFGDPHPLAGIGLQESVESRAAESVATPFAAPALRMRDFLEGRVSSSFPESSYPLALVGAEFSEILPSYVLDPLRKAFHYWGRKYPEFLHEDAIVVAPESRSSSAVRLIRDPRRLESQSTAGLYPIGEGAGYAGGIISAAVDGLRAVEAWLVQTKP